MEEDEGMRFVFKLCDNRYPSGKSLGGQMRSHVISASANSAELEERFESNTMKQLSSFDGNGDGNSSYGLRENPKKTWRASDSSFRLPQERVCKQCGKGFQSLKALCGHMACHSEKERGLKDYNHSWTSESQKLVIDSHSDTEADDPIRLTRSKSKRYKKLNVVKHSFSLDNKYNYNNTTGNNYGSSSVTDIDELEEEEVANCLMMLSKDSGGSWFGVNSVVESSDNNSMVLETKSSSIDKKIRRNEWNCDVLYDPEVKKESIKKKRKYECINCNKIFSSFQGLGGHRPCHKKPNASFVSRYESGENNTEDEIYDLQSKKSNATDLSRVVEKKNKSKKRKAHECPICFKLFKSGQALGGHKRSHFLNGAEERFGPFPVMEKDLIDLNLPAPEED